MERTMQWSAAEDGSFSEESSSSLSDHEVDRNSGKSKASDRSHSGKLSKERKTEAKSGKQRSGAVDFEALKCHGYRVLGFPQPKEIEKQDWTWSTGKEGQKNNDTEESYKERQKTRAALTNGEQLATLQARDEKKNLSLLWPLRLEVAIEAPKNWHIKDAQLHREKMRE